MSDPTARRIAVFSDIHGNLHALDAVLEAIDELGVDRVVCCGDVVGYGAFPNECIERLRERAIPTLAGNHDHAAIGRTDERYFNEVARAAVVWTKERLTDPNAQWLHERPYTTEIQPDFYFVHASPISPGQWGYVLTFGEARACLETLVHRFCFIGHSHQPAVVEYYRDELFATSGMQIPIREERRYLINVGSVGQPRDDNPLACFASVDLDEGVMRYHRIPYDIEAAQKAILENNLPPELAERLAHGW